MGLMRSRLRYPAAWLLLVAILASNSVSAYKEHDAVPMYANKVGPFNNPR